MYEQYDLHDVPMFCTMYKRKQRLHKTGNTLTYSHQQFVSAMYYNKKGYLETNTIYVHLTFKNNINWAPDSLFCTPNLIIWRKWHELAALDWLISNQPSEMFPHPYNMALRQCYKKTEKTKRMYISHRSANFSLLRIEATQQIYFKKWAHQLMSSLQFFCCW